MKTHGFLAVALSFVSLVAVQVPGGEAACVFKRSLSTNLQLVVTREVSDWLRTPEELQKLEAYEAKLPEGTTARLGDVKNIYRFLLKTNEADAGVELYQKQVGSFKEDDNGNLLVILDALPGETNLVVAYRVGRKLFCDVVDRASKKGLEWESAIVFEENALRGMIADRVSIETKHPSYGYVVSIRLRSATNTLFYARQQGKWQLMDGPRQAPPSTRN